MITYLKRMSHFSSENEFNDLIEEMANDDSLRQNEYEALHKTALHYADLMRQSEASGGDMIVCT